jgi:hypothetical protein
MPTEFDLEFVLLALEMIEEFGKPVTWTSVAVDGATYSPATGEGVPVETEYSVKVTPPQAFDPASLRTAAQFEPGDTVAQGEMYVMLAAEGLAFTPKQHDRVTIDGAVWQVTGVGPVYSGELVCAYSARVVR